MPRGTLHSADAVLDWIQFFDPTDDEKMYRFNLSFMLSNHHCIFTGKPGGCPGLLNRGVNYLSGCCERGVTFTSDEDFENTKAHVAQLTPEDWDFADTNADSWYVTRNGKPVQTRKKRDRCIFANSGKDSAVGPGCALHLLSLRTGESYVHTKPEICWAFPIYSSADWVEINGKQILQVEITAVDGDVWGGTDDEDDATGKGYLGFQCTDYPDSYTGNTPLYRSYEHELRHIVGDAAYDELVRQIVLRADNYVSPMPGAVRNEGRPMLPLLIEEYGDRHWQKETNAISKKEGSDS